MSVVQLQAGEVELLTAWSRSGPPRLARKAWLVLEATKGTSTVDLAAATGVHSRRIGELLTRFYRSGLPALFDAPRSGRPARAVRVRHHAVPSALPTVELVASRPAATLWRAWQQVREAGVNTDARTRRVPWPAVGTGPWTSVRAIAAGPSVSVMLLTHGLPKGDTAGHWLFPRVKAIQNAENARYREFDWRLLIELLHLADASPDAPRAVAERRRLWIREALIPTRNHQREGQRTLVVGGDPGSTELLTWIALLRPLTEGLSRSQSPLHVVYAGSATTWAKAIATTVNGRSAEPGESAAKISAWTWAPKFHLWWACRTA
jgi:hypothetical protein